MIAGTAPSDTDPAGTASAVLSTYDLDDAAFAALERRWTRWWSALAG